MLSFLKRVGTIGYSMIMFVMVSVLAGVLVAGLVIPFAGAAGIGSRAAAADLKNLPTALETPDQSRRSKVLDVNGDVLAYFFDQNRVYVPLDKIAPVMRQAQLAIEDSRFYEHGAIDVQGTLRALARNSATGTTQGGSTITQQYVKLVLVQTAVQDGDEEAIKEAQETTYSRKIAELRYAVALEQKFSKDEILERYLNIAYFGEGAYGVEAAAEHYFSTTAAKLTLPQAAMLAGSVQNPDTVNPVSDLEAATARRDFTINRMAELQLITPELAAKAKQSTFDASKINTVRSGCVSTAYPFLCDYVRRTLLQTPSLGESLDEREKAINRGGLTISTKIDPDAQDVAQRAVGNMVDPRDPIISTMTMVEPGTGLIYAMAQSRPVMGSKSKEGETWYNYAVSADMGGAEGYQAGSTFKAFTAAAALEKGIPLTKKYNAKKTMDFGGKRFANCSGTGKVYGDWRVKNSTGTNGVMDMNKAAAKSVNTYFVQLELATGMCEVTNMAKKAGVDLSNPDLDLVDDYQNSPSLTLGTAEVTPLSMAEAYATFASGGIHCDPVIVSTIEQPDSELLAAPDANCERVMSEDVAAAVSSMLGGVMSPNGTANQVRIPGVRYQAGKTGTIDDNKAVWFVGYTRGVAGASMIAIDKTRAPFKAGSANRRTGLEGYTMPYSKNYLRGTGSTDAGLELWRPAMIEATKGKPDLPFPATSKLLKTGKP